MRARVCAGSCSDSDENEEDIDQGGSRSSRSLQGVKQPQRSGEPPEQLVLLIHHLLLVPRGRGGCWGQVPGCNDVLTMTNDYDTNDD